MNLIEIFETLTIPEDGNEKIFNANQIPEYPDFRIAIDIEGNPVLLLKVANTMRLSALKNVRLKHLLLTQNIACKVTEDSKTNYQTFTAITFIEADRHLQYYFLRVSESFIKTLSTSPTQTEVISTINQFVEVFRTLGDPPTKTIQGLWSELFIIENSTEPAILLNYWHCLPEERFDFNSGEERIEVKSNSSFERIHTFASEQLNPPVGTRALIASIFIRQNNSGQTIQHLIDSIGTKIKGDTGLSEKLNAIVCRTLGNSLEQAIRIKFDSQIAKNSLQFYRHQDIHKIEAISIPNQVSEIRYKSNLSELKQVIPSLLDDSGTLFNAI